MAATVNSKQAQYTSSEIASALNTKGYIVLRGAISSEDLDSARNWIETETTPPTDVDAALQPAFEINGAVRKIRRLVFHDPNFWGVWIRRSKLSKIVTELLGEQSSIILHASFKKPALIGSRVVPHQDPALWDNPYPGAITAWVALEDATPENGCLEMYVGSHKRGRIPHAIDKTEDLHEAIDVEAESLTAEPVPMAAGDVILWHQLMAHSSGPNLSNRDRMAMVMVFADAGAPDFTANDCLFI